MFYHWGWSLQTVSTVLRICGIRTVMQSIRDDDDDDEFEFEFVHVLFQNTRMLSSLSLCDVTNGHLCAVPCLHSTCLHSQQRQSVSISSPHSLQYLISYGWRVANGRPSQCTSSCCIMKFSYTTHECTDSMSSCSGVLFINGLLDKSGVSLTYATKMYISCSWLNSYWM